MSSGTQKFPDGQEHCKGSAPVILYSLPLHPATAPNLESPSKDEEVMFEEMKQLAQGLRISEHHSQGTQVHWVPKDTKSSWYFVSTSYTLPHLTSTTW